MFHEYDFRVNLSSIGELAQKVRDLKVVDQYDNFRRLPLDICFFYSNVSNTPLLAKTKIFDFYVYNGTNVQN